MIKFMTKVCVFLITVFVIANLLSLAIMSSVTMSSFMGIKEIGGEVYNAISKSKASFDSETLILGDSVALQLFSVANEDQERICNLTSNQAVSMVGQYIIANNALENNNNVKRIYLFYHPLSFGNDLNQRWTFNYFVKPFYMGEYRKALSDLVLKKLRRRMVSYLFDFPLSKTLPCFTRIDYSPRKHFYMDGSSDKLRVQPVLSEISVEYLRKLESDCATRNIELRVFMPPISKTCDTDFSLMLEQIESNDLERVFSKYFQNKLVLDNSYFVEGIHYKNEFLVDIFESIPFKRF